MTASATADGTSPAPTLTEGETLAAEHVGRGRGEGEEINVGAAAAIEEDGEVEPVEDPDEQAEDEEEVEGDAGEVEAGDVTGASLMEPLVTLKPGEEDEPEELEGAKEELDEESEEATPTEEEPEEVEEGKEECDDIEEKGLLDRSAANGT